MAQTNDVQDSVVGHLKELRSRLIKALVVPFLLFLGFFPFMPSLVHFLQTDLIPSWQLYLFSPAEAVLVQTKLALVLGFAASLPWIFYQLWAFISPGLLPPERKAVRTIVLPSILLLLFSVAFAWKVLVPVMLNILYSMTLSMASPLFGLDRTLSIVTLFLFCSVIMFQVPLVFYTLGRVGLLKRRTLARKRKWAVIVLAIVAAIITPDNSPITMAILAVPMYLLFELSIGLVSLAERRAAASERALEQNYNLEERRI